MVKIGVLGAGSWGLGLAMLLHNNGHDVTVWSVFPDEINELNATRENKKCLPGVIFPESVKFCADTEKVVTESDVLIQGQQLKSSHHMLKKASISLMSARVLRRSL